MSYHLYRFGASELLARLNNSEDIGTGQARIEAIDFANGGSYDQLGKEQAVRGGYRVKTQGQIVATDASDLVTQYNTLRSYLGKRERLYRKLDTGDLQWAWARLENIESTREVKNRLYLEIDLTFFLFSPLWNGTINGTWRLDTGEVLDDTLDLDTTLIEVLDSTTKSIVLTNDGNAMQRNFEFAITAKATPITEIQIVKVGETDFTWTGTIAVNTQLVIDFGAMSIRNNGVDAYNGFVLSGANHLIDDWLRLSPGNNTIEVTRTGGSNDSELAISYFDGWV